MSYEYNTAQVIAALYENEDPVSIDGAAHMQELVNHINELQSRIDSLEKDAERYRWLREQHNKGDDSVTIFIGDEQHGPGHLDAQIDTAMQSEK